MHTSGSMAKKFLFYIITGVLKEKILFLLRKIQTLKHGIFKKNRV